MTWIKIDDHFHAHPKVVRAWRACPAALGLHMLALSHCGAYLTDGHVDERWVRTQLPRATDRQRVVDALLDAGLWEQNGTGWNVHDYLDFNESRAEVQARRSRARTRAGAPAGAGARGRARPDQSVPDLFPAS